MKDISELFAGGYFLTRLIPRPDYLSGDLLPDTILSACSCSIGTLDIVSWTGFNPERLGVPKSKLSEIETWDKTAFGKVYGFPNVFYTLNEARKYVQNFITEPSDELIIVCPAIQHQIGEEVLKTERPEPERGVYETLARREAPTNGGTILGYEPLCYSYDLDHSWLCNSLHEEAFKRWQITPNEKGFLDNLEDATQICDIALEVGAEDGWWLPWLIIQYPVKF